MDCMAGRWCFSKSRRPSVAILTVRRKSAEGVNALCGQVTRAGSSGVDGVVTSLRCGLLDFSARCPASASIASAWSGHFLSQRATVVSRWVPPRPCQRLELIDGLHGRHRLQAGRCDQPICHHGQRDQVLVVVGTGGSAGSSFRLIYVRGLRFPFSKMLIRLTPDNK